MLRWFQAIMPKEDRYFDLFARHATTLVAGADALVGLFAGGAGMDARRREIDDQEHAADDITREVLQTVRRTFITPFDRSAIAALISSMDDAIDEMRTTSKAVAQFEVTQFSSQMRDMATLIAKVARLTAEAMPLLRSVGTNEGRLLSITERIVHVEGEVDELYDSGLRALYREHRDGSPMAFIVGQEIYNHLEKVADRFEDVANEIQGIVIDHA